MGAGAKVVRFGAINLLELGRACILHALQLPPILCFACYAGFCHGPTGSALTCWATLYLDNDAIVGWLDFAGISSWPPPPQRLLYY